MSDTSNYIQATENVQYFSKKPHIYKITNQIDGKYYYGVHNGTNPNYMGSGKLLKAAQEKHGIENFKKEILMWFDTEDEAFEYEAVVVNEKMINKNNPMCYNLVIGGTGGDKYSCQTPERQAEISKKLSDIWNNKPEEEKVAISKKKSDAWNNKPEEEKADIAQKVKDIWNNKPEEEKTEIKQKISDTVRKQWEDKPEEEKADIAQKVRDTWKNKSEEDMADFKQKISGENNGMFGINAFANKSEVEMVVIGKKISVKVSGEKSGNHTKYRHPYDPNFKGNGNQISCDIRKNWPNKPRWNQISRKKKNELKIKDTENV